MADISAIAATASNMSMAQTKAEAEVAVLRRALDAQETQAAQLIESLPDFNPASPATQASAPDPRLGSLIDVRV
ncbi:YjfB family protein [Gammaproteobacteria bacterium AB-CW1]|uniref:YjfB family protein n=1 Tax=Natronospira elongata TaxID=3110268 RepID=A0AAP6JH90_9GAMM|nr:YjfB family protein [Gammaproteobacteria bacterium AB-CW1]